MTFKYVVVVMLVLIVISLGRALYYLSSAKPEDGGQMVKALAWRIGLSLGLFLLLLVGYYSGWIDPIARGPRHPSSGYSQ